MTTFAVVGAGWRAAFYWRLAEVLPDLECVAVVVRRPHRTGHPEFLTVAECIDHTRPDFFVTAVPWAANPGLVTEIAAAGVPVLCETPPAPDRAGLRALWSAVGPAGLVQVAEQYLLMPAHAARSRLVAQGVIGTPAQVQVSSTHQYHAISLMRRYLDVGFGPVTVRASSTTAPLLDPLGREGWIDGASPQPAATVIATLDFGDGRSGLYDFTDNQWHNQLRFRRVLVRGSHGELRDDEVVRIVAPRTIVRSPLVRRQTGYDLDLDGFETDHITLGDEVLYRNPFRGQRWNDEEIAIASLLQQMAAWVRGAGPPPYPLAEGLQDHLLALAIDVALAADSSVITEVEAWAVPAG